MPLKNSTFGEWEVVQSQPYIEVKNQNTGKTFRLTESGGVENLNSLSTTKETLEGKCIVAYGGDGNTKETFNADDYASDNACYQAALDSLPPNDGSDDALIESQGTLLLSQNTWNLTEPELRKGTTVMGVGHDHRFGGTDYTSPDSASEPATRIKTEGHGFVPPNVDTRKCTTCAIKNLTIEGPDRFGTSIGIYGDINSNHWDLIKVENVFIRDFDWGIYCTQSAPGWDSPWILDCHIYRMGTGLIKSLAYGETIIRGVYGFAFGSRGSDATEARIGIDTKGFIDKCQLQGGSGTNAVAMYNGRGVANISNSAVGPQDNGIAVAAAFQNFSEVDRCRVYSGTDIGICYRTTGSTDLRERHSQQTIGPCYFDGNEQYDTLEIADGGTDINFVDIKPYDAVTVNDKGAVRPRWEGEIGGGPWGGVDIGSVDTTAITEGVKAVADGTTNTAGVTYRRFGGSWVDT